MSLPSDLPICDHDAAIKRAFGRGPVVVTSPTGSGKSTWVPVWAADLFDSVWVVEPRRVACRSLARFVAGRLGCELGQQVGYAVRHDDRLARVTRIGYITPGIALQLLDKGIRSQQCIIIDEFHQRDLETDLLLALLLRRGHRRLAVLSATMDGRRVVRHVDGELIEAQGRLYPVTVRHVGDDPVPQTRHLAERVVKVLGRLTRGEGDVLVFLPGKGEIAACQRALARHPVFVPVPLHAQLSPDDQDRAFAPSDRRRVILATNVAETSVTLPWVRTVIDSGLVRRTVYREGRGVLSVSSVAKDAADQRAGRAGRLAPGTCFRLWSKAGKLEPTTPPEILREDLSQLVLDAERLGSRVEQLPWLDPPREFAVENARNLLTELGFFDEAGKLTRRGRQAGRLPVDPVLGRLLLAGREADVLPHMVLLVAALAAGRPFFAPGEPAIPDDGRPDWLTSARCDVTALVTAMQLPKLFRGRIRPQALIEAGRIARQLYRLLHADWPPPDRPFWPESMARAILTALPFSAFARRPRRDAWGNGRAEVVLARESLIDDKVPTILVVDQHVLAERGRRLRRLGTCCMPVAPHLLRKLGAGRVTAEQPKVEDGVLTARMVWSIGTTRLDRFEQVPTGRPAREALFRLLSEGRFLAKAVAAARDQVEAYNLGRVMEGQAQGPSFEEWLKRRIEQIGFESGEDLPLLCEADLEPDLLSPFEQEAIDRAFPRALAIGTLKLTVRYDPTRRRVTLTASRPGQPPPRRDFLPRWPGWTVLYNNGKHTITM